MSRIGKKLIEIPQDVSIVVQEKKIIVKGKHGTLERDFLDILEVVNEEKKLSLKRLKETKEVKAYHGLMRALIQNMVKGVDQQFSKVLIAEGVGYKFQIEKTNLIVNVGYSHPIQFAIPSDLSIKVESNTKISISGIDKERVGFFASQIRSTRPPEPYKGKGILYEGEKILRKAGKTGK
jgi:large subunit ribosomal protein L6